MSQPLAFMHSNLISLAEAKQSVIDSVSDNSKEVRTITGEATGSPQKFVDINKGFSL
jgi:hypothetical protein